MEKTLTLLAGQWELHKPMAERRNCDPIGAEPAELSAEPARMGGASAYKGLSIRHRFRFID